MALRKSDKANLRNRYRIYVESGLAAALLLLIVAFRAPLNNDEADLPVVQEQEVVEIKEIKQTQQVKKPPPPPRPPVPVEVPDDQVLEDLELDLDATLDIDAAVNQAPPPPPAAKEEAPRQEIFQVVEQMPTMIPSQQAGLRQLQQCVNYPQMARRAGVEGTVFVQFVVNEQGNVENPRVVRGPGAGTGDEALRCVRDVKFTPGKQRGRPVKVQMSLPVRFQLN